MVWPGGGSVLSPSLKKTLLGKAKHMNVFIQWKEPIFKVQTFSHRRMYNKFNKHCALTLGENIFFVVDVERDMTPFSQGRKSTQAPFPSIHPSSSSSKKDEGKDRKTLWKFTHPFFSIFQVSLLHFQLFQRRKKFPMTCTYIFI